MSRRKSKNSGTVGYVLLLAALVTAVLAIVGVCITWVTRSGEGLGGLVSGSADLKLGDMFDLYGEGDLEINGAFRVMAAFAILTAILSVATLVLAGISKVLGWKLFRFLLVIAAVVCVVCAVVSIITAFSFCDKGINFDAGDLVSSSLSPAAGAWLTCIGGALTGLIGIGAALKS